MSPQTIARSNRFPKLRGHGHALRLATLAFAVLPGVQAAPPPLPPGLNTPTPSAPALPAGLGAPAATPALPAGLDVGAGSSVAADSETGFENAAAPDWRDHLSGFAEARVGDYLGSRDTQPWASLTEARLQLAAEAPFNVALGAQRDLQGQINMTTDLIGDAIADDQGVDLSRGEGWIDLREANLAFRAGEQADLKIGRQILTWGTGDLLFINDLFPKDWNSFIVGRDDEYLKAPSDAVKVSLFGERVNLDLVYTPRFDADRFIDGQRVTYFSPVAGEIVGTNGVVQAEIPDQAFQDDEIALRLHRLIGATELALYAYQGYWKSPAGADAQTGQATFPSLRVWGASLRQPLGPGLFNAETGYYDSRDDRDGQNPLIANSEWRFLLGYEQEIAPELTAGVQVYSEWLQDHNAYRASLPATAWSRDEWRQVLTLRLTQLMLQQRLHLSLFNFWSPSDQDGHLRLKAAYQWDDHWKTEIGSNLFWGERAETFFGQLTQNDSVFVAVRYGF